MITILERLSKLRMLMEERGIDAYLIPTADFHESEYVGTYFKCREYITGFTGSAGTAVITKEEAGLWTDGRYFVQAARELTGSGITLYRGGQEGVPEIEEYLEAVLPKNGVLGFDGRVVNGCTGEMLKERLKDKGVSFSFQEDLVGMIWEGRPAMSAEPVWILDESYAGKSAKEKISDLRQAMKEKKVDTHIITTLDDIVWLLNIRGGDVACNPVVLSYLILTDSELKLYINESVLDQEVRGYLEDIQAAVLPYDAVYLAVEEMRDRHILLEKGKTNYRLCCALDQSNKILNATNPTSAAKAVKNRVEVENIKKAHIKDGVVMTKFIYWLKTNIGKMKMDEISVSKRLDQLRFQQEGNLGLSFPTISAYRENAAMCHYSASEESSKVLEPEGLYLVDSGGQYYEGTTDVTRTIALGPVTEEEKEHFTLTVMSMLRLGHVKFLHGCRGLNLDYVAREPLWQRGLNYDHGTGHGVGYLLSVHERPNGIRWKTVPERMDSGVLEEGMVTSDEPGIYIEGSHGIRTENLVVCKKAEKTAYGQFMEFEFLTFVPIDLDAVDTRIMEERDLELLNCYHEQVYEKIAPYLTEEEREWLKTYTQPLKK